MMSISQQKDKIIAASLAAKWMKCPECGAEMEEGFINGGGDWRLSWSDQAIIFKEADGVTLLKESSVIPPMKGFRCKNCRIVASYY